MSLDRQDINVSILIDVLRATLEKELSVKTGWGRNEVMTAFDKACVKAICRYAESKGINLD